ncbi:MAG: LPS assembly lipoprotein LptE [Bacteroidales bacterium]|nr:LPS assembly lipoprotein LptE [Bacteroidales bacterium]
MELNHSKNVRQPACGLFIVLLIVGAAILNSCKVSYSFSGASISPAVKTFSVQYFQNRAPLVQPGLSQNLTDALIDKCKAQTNLKYITGIGDASFEGEITDYSTRPQTVAADAQAATNRFTITVKVKFVNVTDPELCFDQSFSRYADYDSSLDLSQVEAELSTSIIEMIVEDIFNRAFVNW